MPEYISSTFCNFYILGARNSGKIIKGMFVLPNPDTIH